MGKSGEATKSLEDFETKAWNEPEIFLTWIPNVGERWTYDVIRKQAEAFQRFGFDNRKALLDIHFHMARRTRHGRTSSRQRRNMRIGRRSGKFWKGCRFFWAEFCSIAGRWRMMPWDVWGCTCTSLTHPTSPILLLSTRQGREFSRSLRTPFIEFLCSGLSWGGSLGSLVVFR